jgi:hypothetical protein
VAEGTKGTGLGAAACPEAGRHLVPKRHRPPRAAARQASRAGVEISRKIPDRLFCFSESFGTKIELADRIDRVALSSPQPRSP